MSKRVSESSSVVVLALPCVSARTTTALQYSTTRKGDASSCVALWSNRVYTRTYIVRVMVLPERDPFSPIFGGKGNERPIPVS